MHVCVSTNERAVSMIPIYVTASGCKFGNVRFKRCRKCIMTDQYSQWQGDFQPLL